MSDCKKCRELFAEALYKELDAEQKNFFKNHLLLCPKCKSEYDEMASTLKVMDKRIRPEPEQAFWHDYENRLAKRMEDEAQMQKPESWWQRFIRNLSYTPKWAFQTTASLLLIILGIFIGRTVFSPPVPELQQAKKMASTISKPELQTQLIYRAHNYIERSKLIFLALINFDPETEDYYALDLPYQQKVSKELVQEASFLREELARYDQRRLQNLIIDLEVILLQIANLESEHDFEAIELVKRGVDSRGILLKIHFTDIRQSTKKGKKTMPAKKASNTFKTI